MPVRIPGMARFLLLLFACLSLLPVQAMAWGRSGHRLVARLAEAQLTPQARLTLQQLLAGEADPSLAGIANWADELRDLQPELGEQSARWHYVNLAEHDCTYLAPRDCADGQCVIEAIQAQTAILADPAQTREARRQALKFVVHLVGDAHQPLHAGYARDLGGNRFQVNFRGKGGNLHSLWDRELLAASGLDEDALLARLQTLTPAAQPEDLALPDEVARWSKQACRVVLQPGFYPAKAKLGEDYLTTWLPVAEQSLADAGTHLAELLNRTLANPETRR